MTKYVAQAQALLTTFKNDQRGITAIEYGLIGVAMAALLATVLGTGDGEFLGELQQAFDSIAATLGANNNGGAAGGS